MSYQRGKVPIIGVICGSKPPKHYLPIGEQVGELVAKEGYWIICGGLGGLMEAVCKGASKHDGFTIGVLPGTSVTDANPYISLPIATGVGYARNSIIVMTADVLVAIDGAEGTLSEMCYGIVYGKPIIAISLESDPVPMGGIMVHKRDSAGFVVVETAKDAIGRVKEILDAD